MSNRFQVIQKEALQSRDDFVVEIVNRILAEAARLDVSDVHFQPGRQELEIRYRQNGVLSVFGKLDHELTPRIAARLKVIAHLLTYKTDEPQEGRVRAGIIAGVAKEMRISSVPTLYGERIAVRFFAEENRYYYPGELGFPADILDDLLFSLQKKSGAILITGPSGSGKTTTAYALIRELVDHSQNEASDTVRSIITLEDPIEHALDHVAQIEVGERNPLSLNEMIKYMLRQDPEVLLVGEIRDQKTAEASLQAALTGHLVITTFHAGSASEAVGRLCEIGIEPFILRSGVTFVLCQRLLRRLCPVCAVVRSNPLALKIAGQSFTVSEYAEPGGCGECGNSGYSGRILLAESLPLDAPEIKRALFERMDTHSIETLAVKSGMIPMPVRAASLLESKITSPAEVSRVLG